MAKLVNMVELCIITTKGRFTEWVTRKDAKDPTFLMGVSNVPTGRKVRVEWQDKDDTLPGRCEAEAVRTGQRPLQDAVLAMLQPVGTVTDEELRKLAEKP